MGPVDAIDVVGWPAPLWAAGPEDDGSVCCCRLVEDERDVVVSPLSIAAVLDVCSSPDNAETTLQVLTVSDRQNGKETKTRE